MLSTVLLPFSPHAQSARKLTIELLTSRHRTASLDRQSLPGIVAVGIHRLPIAFASSLLPLERVDPNFVTLQTVESWHRPLLVTLRLLFEQVPRPGPSTMLQLVG